ADPEASHDARLAAACWRVESAVEALTAPAPYTRDVVTAAATAEAEPGHPVLAHLHALEHALVELAVPLHGARRASLGA
ncbi:FUSC family protein, partial [Streptomyces sp. SID14478]|nr:FUSC family protein [Streptomyces sp. SID14478]